VARRRILLGAVALAAAPVATCVATVVAAWGDPPVPRVFVQSEAEGWTQALGTDRLVVGAVVLGLLVGSLLVRRGAGRTLATTSTVLVFASLAPGFYVLFEALTGAGQVTPRLLLVAPIPVLVGLLCSAAQPGADTDQGGVERTWLQYAGAAVAPVLIALLAAFGTPVWSGEDGADLTTRPTWKVPPRALDNARAVVAESPGTGPVLLPADEMEVLPLVTSKVFAVAPLARVVKELVEDDTQHEARLRLLGFTEGTDDLPASELRAALDALDVSLACAEAGDANRIEALQSTGYANRHRVAGLVCFRPA
jgi:hypothetical protein